MPNFNWTPHKIYFKSAMLLEWPSFAQMNSNMLLSAQEKHKSKYKFKQEFFTNGLSSKVKSKLKSSWN